MATVISFSVTNIFIGRLSLEGVKSIYYFNSGAVLFAILYFVLTREWSKRNHGPTPVMGQELERRKVLTRTWGDNKFDWWSVFICVVGAAFQTCVYFSILICF
jgi:hypothetical protein